MISPRGLALVVGLVGLRPALLHAQQPARLHGVVRNQETGAPVADAEVLLDSELRRSGAGGEFRFGAVDPGLRTVQVRAIGFAARRYILDVLPGEDRRLDVALAPAPVELEPLVVSAASPLTLEHETLIRRGATLGEALDGWEGVVVTRSGAGNEATPHVRGSAADEVLVVLDGFALNDPFTGRADLSRIPTSEVESVTLEPGARTAGAGHRAMAGVLRIRSRVTRDQTVEVGAGSYGMRQGRMGLGWGGGQVDLVAQRFPRGFPYDRPGIGREERANAGGELFTLRAIIRGPVTLTARGAVSNRGLPGTSVNPTPHAWARDRSALVGWRTTGSLVWSGSAEWMETTAGDSLPPPGFPTYHSETRGLGVTTGLGWDRPLDLGPWQGRVHLGGDARYDRFSGSAVQRDADFLQGAVALSAELSARNGLAIWTLLPSLRLDWWSGANGPEPSARLEAALTRKGTALMLAAGSAVSAPALADLLFREGVGIRLNPDLRPERVAWEVEAGASQEMHWAGASLTGHLRGYYGRVNDLVLWTPDFRFIWSPGNFDVLRRGGEAGLALRPSRALSLSLSASYSAVTYTTGTQAQVRYRPRWSALGLVSWQRGGFVLTARGHHLGSRFPNNVGTNPLPPVDLVSVSAEQRLGPVTARVECRDLLDARPTYIAGYPTPGRSFYFQLNLDL